MRTPVRGPGQPGPSDHAPGEGAEVVTLVLQKENDTVVLNWANDADVVPAQTAAAA